ncbi:MAG: O-methyltransferase [Clostridia bacterium]|nr:O-methyltransferase [Clostridia bacterium]
MAYDCLIDPVTEAYLRALPSALPRDLVPLDQYVRAQGFPVSSREAIEFLILLCRMLQPQRILEIGTCVGYSALVMSRLCPNATIDTIERNPAMISDAKANLDRYHGEHITLFEGDAAVILPNLSGPYDLIYLDAAKGQYPAYLPDCVRLLREGGVFLVDDVLFRGQVPAGKPDCHRNQTIVNRLDAFIRRLKDHPQLTTTVLPISDGMTVSVKRSPNHGEKA